MIVVQTFLQTKEKQKLMIWRLGITVVKYLLHIYGVAGFEIQTMTNKFNFEKKHLSPLVIVIPIISFFEVQP